jgi:hypothetical protein
MKGKTPVKINEVQFLVEVKTQAERPGSLICSTNWNLFIWLIHIYSGQRLRHHRFQRTP